MATRPRLVSSPPIPVATQASPAPSGWVWDGTRWVCDPCDGDFDPCPPAGWPTPCPPWFPPPSNQAPWYPGANGGVSFSQSAPVNPVRGNFWWNGSVLQMFDGAAWVLIGPAGTGGGVAIGPSPPPSPFTGQLWFNGVGLFVFSGSAWVSSAPTTSYVQGTAPVGPRIGDTWWDGSHQWIWDGALWQLIGGTGAAPAPPGQRSITPVLIPWAFAIVPDFSQFINAYINVTGNFTLGSPINVTPGQRGIIKLNQDAVGGRTWLVSPAWYFLGGTGAPALSTGANARDILHYYVGENSIVYGELHTDFMANSGPSAPPVVTSTNIGNMTLNGGLAAAFNGINAESQAASARANNSNLLPGTFSGYVGKSYSTPQRVLSATYWPPNTGTAGWAGTAGLNAQYSLVVNLRGKTGSTPPSGPTDGTLLASFSYGASAPSQPASFFSSAALVPNDMNTAFSFVFVEVALTWAGSGPTNADVFCSQLILDVHT